MEAAGLGSYSDPRVTKPMVPMTFESMQESTLSSGFYHFSTESLWLSKALQRVSWLIALLHLAPAWPGLITLAVAKTLIRQGCRQLSENADKPGEDREVSAHTVGCIHVCVTLYIYIYIRTYTVVYVHTHADEFSSGWGVRRRRVLKTRKQMRI